MNPPRTEQLDTTHGPIHVAERNSAMVYRVGYTPSPWEWTPWEFATEGLFSGRWDDPEGVWRTLYCAASALTCFLEVLAFARPSPDVVAALADIIVDDDDETAFPTLPPGSLPRSWADHRMVGRGALTGRFALPAHPQSLATLRSVFRPLAIRYGLDDLDTAALRDGRPRAVTKAISAWLYATAVDGIEFDSRHGDDLRIWAIYELDGDPAISPRVDVLGHFPISHNDMELAEAMRLLHLVWADG